jgi:hypothetical protein
MNQCDDEHNFSSLYENVVFCYLTGRAPFDVANTMETPVDIPDMHCRATALMADGSTDCDGDF